MSDVDIAIIVQADIDEIRGSILHVVNPSMNETMLHMVK